MTISSLYKVQLPVFEGPLDLLLRLIEQEELDITTVALAQVADQYLAHLAELEERQARDLSDFLVVAAKLLLIKSEALLPRPPSSTPEAEAEDTGDQLVQQLLIYKRFKSIANLLHEREKQGLHSYIRLAPLPERDPQLDIGEATIQDLLRVAQEALDVVNGPPVGEVVSPVTVTIDEQIELIKQKLSQRRQIRFRQLLSAATTRVEIIVTLLAVLELIKQDQITVKQEKLFSAIILEESPEATFSAAPTTESAA